MSTRFPTYFVPHGGGPWPFIEGSFKTAFAPLGAWLRDFQQSLPARPKAMLVISAHWETPELRLNTVSRPQLYYDYYGFPEQTYRLSYPAPGAPELVPQVKSLLEASGFPVSLDSERGWDHGVFVPFMLMFPAADIPLLQLSLRDDLDPDFHLRVGEALAPLRDQGILIIGSGMSFHNLRVFGQDVREPSLAFDNWLTAAVEAAPAERNEQLKHWADAPYARFSQPREDHLLPLMVVAGAAGADAGESVFRREMAGSYLSAYRFGN